MRQTPFGVWNALPHVRRRFSGDAAMRQTPFGVWNRRRRANHAIGGKRCNEADTFRRLEPGVNLYKHGGHLYLQ